MKGNKVYPVILCGGTGSRLWPLSRESYPKQFINLNPNSKDSMLQATYKRLFPLELSSPIIICNQEHRFIVAEQMREINVNPNSIILEPKGKNTAPAIALAALTAIKFDTDPILLVLASDHIIKENEKFIASLFSAINLAKEGRIVTFGIIPTYPETGFGYIESYDELNIHTLEGSDIKKFYEKPNQEIAAKFIGNKKYSWNSGMFVFKAKTILDELKNFEPELYSICKDSIDLQKKDLDFQRLDEEIFDPCPSISIDNAVMERTKIGSVVPLDANWSDIGTWKSLWEYSSKDQNRNLVHGKVFLKNVQDSLFRSEGRLIVGAGLKDLVVVDTLDATLIANKNSSQDIKSLVNLLKNEGFEESTFHKKGFRPWGSYISIAKGDNWQVKLIEVKPKSSLSLQRHKYRTEHWIVVTGNAMVRIEDREETLLENQSTFIPLGAKHQLSNPLETTLNIIEVQSGSYLGEDDIERFEDDYGRVNNF